MNIFVSTRLNRLTIASMPVQPSQDIRPGKLFGYTCCLFLMLILAGCGSSKGVTEPTSLASNEFCLAPTSMDAYQSSNETMLFGLATAVSPDMQIAYDKAALSARNQIAQTIETELISRQEQLTEEINIGVDAQLTQRFRQLVTSSAELSLKNSEIVERSSPCREGGNFRAHVAVGVSRVSIAKDFLDRIKRDDFILAAVQEEESYLDFEEEVANADGN